MTTEVSTEVNNLLTAEEALWQDAEFHWMKGKAHMAALCVSLASLRKRYTDNEEFGMQCSKHLPDLDHNVRAKLIKIGANVIARGNDVPAAEIFSLSLDALTEFSKAPIEQQHQIEADVKAGKKITAKKIKEDNGTAKPAKQSDREKELMDQLATMNQRYAEAQHNFEATMDELEELRAEVEATPLSGAAVDKLKEELRQAKAEAAKARAEAEQARAGETTHKEAFEYNGLTYEKALKAIKFIIQKTHPDQAGAGPVAADAYTLAQLYKENLESLYSLYKGTKQK